MSKVINLSKFRRPKKKKIRPKRSIPYRNSSTHITYRAIISILAVLSVLIGSLFYSKFAYEPLSEYLTKTVLSLQENGFKGIFKELLIPEIITMVMCFILSTNLVGNILISLVPITKLFVIGYLGALVYNQYELNGVLFSLIFLIPYFSLTGTLLIALTYEGYSLSKEYSNAILQRKTAKENSLQLFLVKYIIILIIDVVFVALNSLLLSEFGSKITLR